MKQKRIQQLLLTLSVAALICVLTACGSGGSSQDSNTVAPWTPQDEQSQQLVQLLTSNKTVTIVSCTADENIRTIKRGCKYYENGKLIADEDLGTSEFVAEEGSTKSSKGLISVIRSENNYELSVSCNGNISSVSDIEIPGYKDGEDDHSFAVGELINEVSFKEGEPVYLVAYYNTEDGETHAYDPQSLMEDPDLLKSNEKTWIVYAVFSSKPLD
ncbi:MAG: hypothetical protein IJI05_01300 [Erysipelotrichaceae bacterium]|nr:hypothetical protein [Erysipelotrichaceae bacterium]